MIGPTQRPTRIGTVMLALAMTSCSSVSDEVEGGSDAERDTNMELATDADYMSSLTSEVRATTGEPLACDTTLAVSECLTAATRSARHALSQAFSLHCSSCVTADFADHSVLIRRDGSLPSVNGVQGRRYYLGTVRFYLYGDNDRYVIPVISAVVIWKEDEDDPYYRFGGRDDSTGLTEFVDTIQTALEELADAAATQPPYPDSVESKQ